MTNQSLRKWLRQSAYGATPEETDAVWRQVWRLEFVLKEAARALSDLPETPSIKSARHIIDKTLRGE